MICFSSFVVLIIEMELETFKITVLPLRQKMLNFSQRLVEDTAEAEDVVQEAFIKLWYIREKLDAYHRAWRRWLCRLRKISHWIR